MCQAYYKSREANEDEFGDVKLHLAKDLKKEIFEAKCRLVENQGNEGWAEVANFLFNKEPRAVHFVMDQFR